MVRINRSGAIAMQAEQDDSPRNGNRLLAALPCEERDEILSQADLVALRQRDTLWEPNEPIPSVFFPTTCVTSVLAVDPDRGAVEVGTVGNEGMAGLPVFLGAQSTPQRALIQISGWAYRLDSRAFLSLANESSKLREVLHLYTQGFVAQVSQSVACNLLHDSRRRLARWLLMCHDRVGQDEFEITQDFMAQMLRVRRATVNEAAGALQEAGLISLRRGVLQVGNRAGLEDAACPCYRIVRDEFDRLFGGVG
jgi:CRP-like cAMP-binding protein